MSRYVCDEVSMRDGCGVYYICDLCRAALGPPVQTCPPHRCPPDMPSEVIAWRCVRCGEVIRG